MIDKDVVEALKARYTKIRSQRDMLQSIAEQNTKKREAIAEKLREQGIEPEDCTDSTLVELEAKAKDLANTITQELDTWEEKLNSIQADVMG